MHWLLALIPGAFKLGEAIAKAREQRSRLKREQLEAKRANDAKRCDGGRK